TQALRKGGRIVFVGAGTSGRLGVLESAEMPPTFGTNPDLVQAIMAGGKNAVLRAKEGVEDNYEEGARSVNRLRPTRKDVVIGVSASGMTQFVRGALTRARRAGSKIIFVTCDPRTELQTFVDLTIAPAVGPEVIAGSTRVKAAIVMQKTGLPYVRAVSRLRKAHDFVRDAIGEDVEPRLRELLDNGARST